MGIDFNSIEDMSIDEILSFLDEKRIKADRQREESKKLLSAFESTKIVKNTVSNTNNKDDNTDSKEEDKSFEKEANYYLEKILKLEKFDRESVEAILPYYGLFYS